jgi:chromosome segregation ATPase
MSQIISETEITLEMQSEVQPQGAPEDLGTLAVSADEFAALEERVLRAVDLVKRERQARATAEERAAKAEEKLRAQSAAAEQLHGELNALRAERDQVRQRVDRLLKQLDALEL